MITRDQRVEEAGRQEQRSAAATSLIAEHSWNPLRCPRRVVTWTDSSASHDSRGTGTGHRADQQGEVDAGRMQLSRSGAPGNALRAA